MRDTLRSKFRVDRSGTSRGAERQNKVELVFSDVQKIQFQTHRENEVPRLLEYNDKYYF